MSTIRTTDQVIRDAVRTELRNLLELCTAKQRKTFQVIFPGTIASLSDETLRTAIALCQRTIRSNEKKDAPE
jgi:hypothetical protein